MDVYDRSDDKLLNYNESEMLKIIEDIEISELDSD